MLLNNPKNTQECFYNHLRFDTLWELIDNQVRVSPDNYAFEYKEDGDYIRITYAQFQRDICRTAYYFQCKGYKKIAIAGMNSYQYIVAMFAACSNGCIFSPLDSGESLERILYYARDGDILLYDSNVIVKDKLIQATSSYDMNFLSLYELDGIADEIDDETEKQWRSEVNPDSVCFLMHTSGTTAVSKGVLLSHANICSNVYYSCQRLNLNKRSMLLLPLHHMYGILSLLVVLANGAESFLLTDRKRMFYEMKRFKTQQLIIVPLFVQSLCKVINAALKELFDEQMGDYMNVPMDDRQINSIEARLSDSIETIISGGAPLDMKYSRMLNKVGIEVFNGYGITECSPLIAVNTKMNQKDRSVGKVIPCCEVKIWEPVDGIGEILVRGENVMIGYYENEEFNRQAFDGEWFRTGDYGYLDEEGYLFITGRKKNLIICSNGENVSPEELEEVLAESPIVTDVIVTSKGDQYITAEILPNYEWIEEDKVEDVHTYIKNMIDTVNQKLPLHKNIHDFCIRENEFVRNSSGKILRY